ncbi:MAG: tyrosine protein phosphatase [Planctomycetota bacterium]
MSKDGLSKDLSVVDLHHHILPGVDDGPADLDAALDLARMASAEGIETVVATPHTLDGVFDAPRERCREALAELRQGLERAGCSLQIRLAAEVRLHEDLPSRLCGDPTLSLDGQGRYLLLELPHAAAPQFLPDFLFGLLAAGTAPVIAHPERNMAVRKDPRIALEWVKIGCLLQLTSGSLTGFFGDPIRRSAEHLLRLGAVHVLATDAHSPSRRPPIARAALEAARRIVGEEDARLLLEGNPALILAGEGRSAVRAAKSRKRSFFSFAR